MQQNNNNNSNNSTAINAQNYSVQKQLQNAIIAANNATTAQLKLAHSEIDYYMDLFNAQVTQALFKYARKHNISKSAVHMYINSAVENSLSFNDLRTVFANVRDFAITARAASAAKLNIAQYYESLCN